MHAVNMQRETKHLSIAYNGINDKLNYMCMNACVHHN